VLNAGCADGGEARALAILGGWRELRAVSGLGAARGAVALGATGARSSSSTPSRELPVGIVETVKRGVAASRPWSSAG